MKCLAENDRMALMEIRSEVSFAMILKSSEPNFTDLKREMGIKELVKPVTVITKSFLQTTFPDQQEISVEIAAALIEREPTWTLLDVINFYKTIINRQDIEGFQVFGNKITLLKLMEMVGCYEGLKADEREKVWAEEKGKYTSPAPRSNSDQSVKSTMGKMLETISIRDDNKKPYSVPADEKYFKSIEEAI